MEIKTLSRDCYFNLNGKLNETEFDGYRAAGLLPYQWNKETNKIFVLLTAEKRTSKGGMVPSLNVCGGKREEKETNPLETAQREFWEETGQLFPLDKWKEKFASCPVLWYAPGKYALFLYPVPKDSFLLNIDRLFSSTPTERCDVKSKTHDLFWIDLSELVQEQKWGRLTCLSVQCNVKGQRKWSQCTDSLSGFLQEIVVNSTFIRFLNEQMSSEKI